MRSLSRSAAGCSAWPHGQSMFRCVRSLASASGTSTGRPCMPNWAKAVGGKGHAQAFLHHQQYEQGFHTPVGHFRRDPCLLAGAQQHVRNADAQQRAVQQKTLRVQRPQGSLGLPAPGMLRRQGHPPGFVHHLLVLQLRRRQLAAADDQVQAALAQALEQAAGFPSCTWTVILIAPTSSCAITRGMMNRLAAVAQPMCTVPLLAWHCRCRRWPCAGASVTCG